MAVLLADGIGSRRRVKPYKATVFAPVETRAHRIKRIATKTIIWTSVVGTILVLAAGIASILFYNHYAAIVEKRVNSGFWQTRAGMYAAPYQIRKDQQATPDAIVEQLRRAGYIEGTTEGTVWNGSYEKTDGGLKITTSNAYNLEPEITDINFAGNRIKQIEHNGAKSDTYQIEPEMLSGRSETKRAKNHVLKFEDIPENLRNAILAAEDQRFFDHHGIDPRGIGRALIANLSGREIKQGGSTITQQLVKNTFLTPERSFTRKFSEAFLSIALENKMSKQDIFAVYCNEIYLGQYGASGVNGVEQAARAYFDKDLKNLTLDEAATIAAMIKNPRAYSPQRNPENSRDRRNWILARMSELGLSNASDIELAKNVETKLAPPKANDRSIAPYFVDAAMREITTKFDNDYLNSNFNTRVYTTIDTQLQTAAERAVTKHLEGLDRYYSKKSCASKEATTDTSSIQNPKSKIQNTPCRLQATIVALDPHTGHVLAMVGGRDYHESQFNRATDALRAPGSTFKPIVYATAYERGYSPISTQADQPTEFATIGGKLYKPSNYHGSYSNTNLTLKSALVKSSNVIAVKTAMDVGLGSVAKKAREFGFENIQTYPSMALGTMETTPLQLAAAYAVFANGGTSVEPTFIDKVVSGSDQVLHLSTPTGKQVVREQTAYMVTDALMDVVRRGTAAKANGALGKNVVFAGKTGTSKDGWFVGYTPNLVTVAWVGLDDNEDIHATGGDIAVPLWVDFMREVVRMRPEFGGANFTMPKGLTEVVVDPETGMAAGPYCPQRETAVVPASAATSVECFKHQPLTTMYASADVHEMDPSVPYTTTVEAEEVTPPQAHDSRYIVEYEDYSGSDDRLNVRKSSAPGTPRESATQTRPTLRGDESYLEQYERAEKAKKPE